MLGDRPPEIAAQLEGAQAMAVDLPAQLPVKLSEHAVVGDLEEALMELRVRLEEARHVTELSPRCHLLDQLLHRGQVLGRQLRNRQPHRHHLERLANLVRLDELLARECADDGPPARADGDEALGGEPAERLADRATADTERPCEGDLVKLGAGGQSPGDDLVAEVVVYPLPERAVIEDDSSSRRLRLDIRVGGHLHRALARVINAPLNVNGRQPTLTPPRDPGNP
jgi:hypothetical protein